MPLKTIIFTILTSIPFLLTAQTEQPDYYLEDIQDSSNFDQQKEFEIEVKPEFPGGPKALKEYFSKYTKYPLEAQNKNIVGKVYIQFIIDKRGFVKNTQVARGVHPLIDVEALKAVSLMPKWKPGIQYGKAVSVSYVVPITFSINNNTEKDFQNISVEPRENGQYYEGLDYYQKKEYVQAISYFDESLILNPNATEVLYKRAFSFYYLGQLPEACRDWTHAAIIGDEKSKSFKNMFCPDHEIVPLYHKTAQQCLKNKAYQKSIEYYDLIISANPSDTIALLNKALSNYKLTNLDSACFYWKKLKSMDTKEANEYYHLYCSEQMLLTHYYKEAKKKLTKEEYTKAIGFYDRIIKIMPNAANVYLNRAKAYYKINEKEKACIDIKKAIEIGNEQASSLLNSYCE